jgi:glycosyltransferase involved in cell wall biosynthesis
MTLISIIIPTYNRARFLPLAIESVLRQSVKNLEVIVVDDGSTDNTLDIVQALSSDHRIRYVPQVNSGRSIARNHGAHLAKGEFIGFLDSDDCYLASCLQTHINLFANHPDLGMSIGGYDYIDNNGRLLGTRTPWAEGGELDIYGWLFNCYAMPGSTLMRKTWFDRTRGFDSKCEIAEDWALFLELAVQDCSMEWVRESVCQYRLHSNNSVALSALHRDAALVTLDKFFADQRVPSRITALRQQAEAWILVLYAKKAYLADQADLAVQSLERAVKLDKALMANGKQKLLEFLLTSTAGQRLGNQALQTVLLAHSSSGFSIRLRDLARAQARVEMALFFQNRIVGRDNNAFQHLQAAIKLDPSWLANRGVLAFCLKGLLQAVS